MGAPDSSVASAAISLRSIARRLYLTRVGTYERYGQDIGDDSAKPAGKGDIMFGDEWLAVIKAEREREIKAIQRAHLVDRNRFDEEAADAPQASLERSVQRAPRPIAQPGRPTTDPSL
jgi:hypothetical protein